MDTVSPWNVRELEKHHWEGQRVQVLRLLCSSEKEVVSVREESYLVSLTILDFTGIIITGRQYSVLP